MIASPLSSASCFISRMVTGMPAFRKFIAMPPPMVPAPMTPTFLMSRTGVSAGTSGILVVARSAMKAWRKAFDSGVNISAVKASRSRRMPSSNFWVTAASTTSMHLSGAGKFLLIPPTMLRANWK